MTLCLFPPATAPKVTVLSISGLQAGDEGKGKIADAIAKMIRKLRRERARRGAPAIKVVGLRYNGGPNAGHTVYVGSEKVDTHQVPTTVLQGFLSVIGPTCLVDAAKLDAEITRLAKYEPRIRDLLLVGKQATLILPEHIAEDKATDKIGSTHCGITPASKSLVGKTAIRVQMLIDYKKGGIAQIPELLRDQEPAIKELAAAFVSEDGLFCGCRAVDSSLVLNGLPQPSGKPWADEKVLSRWPEDEDVDADVEIAASDIASDAIGDVTVIAEGAQAHTLDRVWTPHAPYHTSGACTVSEIFAAGVPATARFIGFGVAKSYRTLVGNMKFQPSVEEDPVHGPVYAQLQEEGCEFGVTTGRKRQVRYIDLDELIVAIRVNAITTVFICKQDVLETVVHARGGMFAFVEGGQICEVETADAFCRHITEAIKAACPSVASVIFSKSPKKI